MNLASFIDTFRDSIAQRVVESYPPLYRPSEQAVQLPRLLRSPLGAQADAIRGAALSLKAHQGTTVVGEMGTGKTFIAAGAAHAAGFRRVSSSSARRTWFPSGSARWRRRCPARAPPSSSSITDLERLRLLSGSAPLFAVMSREKAKLSYRWQPAINRAVGRVANGRLDA